MSTSPVPGPNRLPVRYLGTVAAVVIGHASCWMGGAWTLTMPAFVFGLQPLLDLMASGPPAPVDDPPVARGGWSVDALLYGLACHHQLCFASLFWLVAHDRLNTVGLVGGILTLGIGSGSIGFAVAHELTHRQGRLPRVVALWLYGDMLYGNYRVEHLRGHHRRVGMREDPGTPRRGESVYRFLPRVVAGSWWHAWQLEGARLSALGKSRWSLGNEVLLISVIQALAVSVVGWWLGSRVLMAWLAVAFIGVVVTEIGTYVQHYGLERPRLADGRYAPVDASLSWNSSGPITQVLQLELARHSDHHLAPGRSFQHLRHLENEPSLPGGYSGLVLLALVPPLWFQVVNPRLDAIRA